MNDSQNIEQCGFTCNLTLILLYLADQSDPHILVISVIGSPKIALTEYAFLVIDPVPNWHGQCRSGCGYLFNAIITVYALLF